MIHRQIDLECSDLNDIDKQRVFQMLSQHRPSFSLYGELGTCPGFEVDFDLTDHTPFYIRPYSVTEQNKKLIDAELTKLVDLGILARGYKTYTSPVLLVNKKNDDEKRVVTDFRYLNSRIKRHNHPFQPFSQVIQHIGHCNPSILRVIDIKSAFHSLSLIKKTQEYVGLSSYSGGQS